MQTMYLPKSERLQTEVPVFEFPGLCVFRLRHSNFEYADILQPFNLAKTKVVLAWKKIQKCTLKGHEGM